MSETKKVLFIVGSLREASFNRQLAQLAARSLDGRAEVAFLDYADVPFMNQDIEFPAPQSVTRVREEVAAASALWFVSPEYNHAVPAQLKNLVDWLSRPLVAGDYATPRPLTDKPAVISGAGGRGAALDGRRGLEELLGRLDARVIGGAGEGFVLPKEAWVQGVYAVSPEDEARLAAQGDALIAAL